MQHTQHLFVGSCFLVWYMQADKGAVTSTSGKALIDTDDDKGKTISQWLDCVQTQSVSNSVLTAENSRSTDTYQIGLQKELEKAVRLAQRQQLDCQAQKQELNGVSAVTARSDAASRPSAKQPVTRRDTLFPVSACPLVSIDMALTYTCNLESQSSCIIC